MKNKSIITVLMAAFMLLYSCDEYKTRVTNIVHTDGSVTRKVVMSKNNHEPFDPSKYLVPLDATWDVSYSMEISEENDTTWTLTAEKHFSDVNEINASYEADTGTNASMKRSASFDTRYRWFYTVYHFEEKVDKILAVECPVDTFMTDEELRYFYLPESIRDNLENGEDSITYRELRDNIESAYEKCLWRALIKQMIQEFYALESISNNSTLEIEQLTAKEDEFYETIVENEDTEGYETEQLVRDVMGNDFYERYASEIDSAGSLIEDYVEIYMDAKTYDMEIVMPGKLIASNGYLETNDSTDQHNNLLWSVSGDYFFTQDFKMWAESRIINIYAWVISGIVILLALLLLLFRKKKH